MPKSGTGHADAIGFRGHIMHWINSSLQLGNKMAKLSNIDSYHETLIYIANHGFACSICAQIIQRILWCYKGFDDFHWNHIQRIPCSSGAIRLPAGDIRDNLTQISHWIVRSKLDYGCIVYGTASNTNLRQLDSIHNAGLRLALRAFCTSPVSSMYTDANEAPLEERRLKLSMNYYLKTCAFTDNPAHHALHEFGPTTRDLHLPRPNGKGGMTRPPTKAIGLKVEEAMSSAEIAIETVCPLKTPTFPPGTHEYEPKRHSLIEGVSKCTITREEAQAKFTEYCNAQGPHDEVYTDGFNIDKRVGAAAVINRHFQNGETTCRQPSKRLPNNSTIFAAEATPITQALNYYRHIDPVQHDVVIYSDSMSCLQAIEGKDTNNPLICQIMNLLWALSDKGTCVRFCWMPSHCGIEGNEIVDQLAKETLDHDIDPLTTVHFADLKPLVNSHSTGGPKLVGCINKW